MEVGACNNEEWRQIFLFIFLKIVLLCWILNRVMQKTTKIFLNGLQRPINCESWVELLDKKERFDLGPTLDSLGW